MFLDNLKQDSSPKMRAAIVCSSQGKAVGFVEHLPTDVIEELAELCDLEGNLRADVSSRFKEVLFEYYQSQKAETAHSE